MSEFTIYHNPKCSKSRQTLELLKEKGIEPEIVEYLKAPLAKTEVLGLLSKYAGESKDFVRVTEDEYKQNKPDLSSADSIAAAIEKYPKLLERPIVVKGDSAVIGRPPENVLGLI